MTIPNNNRRTFLKKIGLLSISTFRFPSILTATPQEKPPASSNIWYEILEYARWCPTIHNMQPHKVKILSNTEAILHYDTARLLPVEDPDCRFCTVAMGIFIEHISIAAAVHQLKIDFVLLHNMSILDKGIVPFAKLKLVSTDKNELIDREWIKKRRTSRLHYDGSFISQNILKYVKNEANTFDNNFHSTTDKNIINEIIELNQKTLFEDLGTEATRNELDSLFRYDKQTAQTKKDGLWSVCMNFPGWLMRSVFQHYQKWDHGIKKDLITNFYRESFRGTGTLGWFTSSFNNTTDWITAGRMLARNWLFLTSQNIYIQPFGSLITNKHAYDIMNNKLNPAAGDKKLWMVFRLGYSKEPARSYRLDLKDILI